MTSLEMLSYDIIEDSFFNVFKPIYLVQSVLGTVRFKYKDKFISGTTVAQRAYSSVALLVSVYCVTYTSISLFPSINAKEQILRYIQVFFIIFSYISLILNNSFFNRNLNKEIYVKLQNIDRLLKISEKDKCYTFLRNYNYVGCLGLIVFYFAWIFVFSYAMLDNIRDVVLTFLAFYAFSVEDLEVVNFTFVIKYLELRVKFINSVLVDSMTTHLCKGECSFDLKNDSCRLFYAYHEIAETYHSMQYLYRPFIFIITSNAFLLSMATIETLLIHANKLTYDYIFQCIFLYIKATLRPIYAGISNDVLKIEVTRTKRHCLLILTKHHEKCIRKCTKNIVRLLKVRMKSFSVYSVFDLDSRLFVRLFALITTYTVVSLQFAFL